MKWNRSSILLGAALIIVAVSSCKTYTSYDDLMHLKKGMSSHDAEKEFGLEAKSEYKISQSGAAYLAKRYQMQIGTTTSTSSSGGSFGPGGYTPGPTITTTSANTVGYLLLFRDDRLLYWGFLQEFAKCEDTTIMGLSSQIRSQYYDNRND